MLTGLSGILVLMGLSGWQREWLGRKQRRLQDANDQLEAKVRERTLELPLTPRNGKSAQLSPPLANVT
jgi:C4-dicarboxylate-specific signal transduction histidine kinase